MLLARKLTVNACAAPKRSENVIQVAKRRFEKKRFVSLKENFNKLVAIATADTKELQEFLVELDELHKKELNFGQSGAVVSAPDAEDSFFDK